MENNLQNDNSFNVEPDTEDLTQISPVAAAESEPTEVEGVSAAQTELLPDEPALINNETIFIGCPEKKPINWWLLTTIVIGIYFILSTFVFRIVLEPLEVVGASMYPTLNGGDLNESTCDVVYLERTHKYNKLDIVVFKAEGYTGEDSLYIKRVIGVAGDVIQFKKNTEAESLTDPNGYLVHEYFLYINGVLQQEDYVNQETLTPNAMLLRMHASKDESQYAKIINEEEIVVGEGEIFVLGDNRRISNDSKYFGCVKTEDCIGKVVLHVQYGEIIFKAFFRALKKNYLK